MRKSRRHSADSREWWPDDVELQAAIRTAQQGEPGAVDALLARLRPLFMQYFDGRVDQDTADDLTQDALFGVLKALPRLDPGRGSRYVTRLARYQLGWASRRRDRDAQRFAPIEAALDIPSPVRADREIDYADLKRAAAGLPPRIRACVLEALRGLSAADIALAHDVSPTTVRLQLQRGRALLRAALGLSATERHMPRGPNDSFPKRVREPAPLRYQTKRFPALQTRSSRGGRVAARAGRGPRRGRAPTPWRRRAGTTHA